MQVFVNENPLKERLNFLTSKGLSIGFVPTMGALHEGHLSLIRASKAKCEITVCSIFVNPTQFNNKDDLKKYPKTLSEDKRKLRNAGVDIVFAPTEKVIYPENMDLSVDIDLEGLDKKWEGKFRPGHFKGVVQVVKRLLDIVVPDYLFMGQKDFQQFTIIQMMLNKLKIPVKLEVVPIFRESDGLAMSSRNVRLTEEFRKNSTILYEALCFARDNYDKMPISELENTALKMIGSKNLKPEYFKIVEKDNLEEITTNKSNSAVAIVAAWAGDVRLIDNMVIK